METFKIKAILAAAQYKSMSQAAEEFSYTQSAFSHMTASFEKELGVQLFHRTSKGVEWTDAGKALYPKLCAILQCEEELLRAASEQSENTRLQLRIATYSSISRNYLSSVLHAFKEAHPEIHLSVAVSDVLTGWLEEDRADIIFADRSAAGNNEWVTIMEDEYLVLAPSHMLQGRDEITREELYGYPQIFTADKPLQKYFDISRFREITYFRSEDDLSVVNMVRAGMGITVQPALALRGNTEGMHLLHLTPRLNRTLGFAYRKKYKKRIELSTFIRFITK